MMNRIDSQNLKISVVTPTHNRLEYLKQAVASVQATVVQPLNFQFEHVIHDCGSTDGTKEYFLSNLAPEKIFYFKDRQWTSASEDLRKDGIGELPSNVIYIRSENKAPPSQARSVCIEKSTGQFICVLDDDDVFLQRTLHKFANAILQNPTKQFFTSDFLRVNEQLQYILNDDYYGWIFSSPQEMLQAIFDGSHFIQGNVCFSRQLYDRVGGYDQSVGMAEDLDLYVRFLIQGDLNVYLPMISHLHRMHTSNFSIGCDVDHHHRDLREIYGRNADKLKKMEVTFNLK